MTTIKIPNKKTQTRIIDITAFSETINSKLLRSDMYEFYVQGLIYKKIDGYRTINYENLCQVMNIIRESFLTQPSQKKKKSLQKIRKWVKIFRMYLEYQD